MDGGVEYGVCRDVQSTEQVRRVVDVDVLYSVLGR